MWANPPGDLFLTGSDTLWPELKRELLDPCTDSAHFAVPRLRLDTGFEDVPLAHWLNAAAN